MEPFLNIRIPWYLLVEPCGKNVPTQGSERYYCKMKILPLFKMPFQLFLLFFISFEDLEKWRENVSRWDTLSTAQNLKSLWYCVEFLGSKVSWTLTVTNTHDFSMDMAGSHSGPQADPPPDLPQWLMCNITSECECKHFNMKRIDFCHRHGILMIGNNILIFFLIKAIFPLIMEGLALCEIYIHSPWWCLQLQLPVASTTFGKE